MPSLEINFDLGATVQQPSAPNSIGSTAKRDKDKYPVDHIKDPTPCTLIYVKGGTSRATVMPSRIHQGHEFEDLV
jgi:hypothetical protein